MNGCDRGSVIFGASSSQLCKMLADCYADGLKPGDEIIFAETSHEANVNPWFKLADRQGIVMRAWPVRPGTCACELDDLRPRLNDRTRLVCFSHVSNLLGEIVDVGAITDLAHEAGAEVVVDGVAYAPHRPIDVAAWNVDYYFYSTYKVYGPHMAAMFGTHQALARLTGPNHFFIPRQSIPYKFELGCLNHEGCAGVLALGDYLQELAGEPRSKDIDRETIARAMNIMASLELPLQARLIEWLRSRRGVRIVGPAHGELSRVATISFVHESKRSALIARAANEQGIGIRNGHMYAYRLCQALGIDPADGVVRISAVHYNTMDEIEKLLEVLDAAL
jgi:cysteine desulfurase family protein (TIGR01976 family)